MKLPTYKSAYKLHFLHYFTFYSSGLILFDFCLQSLQKHLENTWPCLRICILEYKDLHIGVIIQR